MEINDELLAKLANLSKVNVAEDQKEKMKKDLSEILTWMEKLNEVNTEGVEPMTTMSKEENRWREDSPGTPMDRKTALDNAPVKDQEFFKVPKVLKNK